MTTVCHILGAPLVWETPALKLCPTSAETHERASNDEGDGTFSILWSLLGLPLEGGPLYLGHPKEDHDLRADHILFWWAEGCP